ncbi:MAG: stearoyl-CoA 9-desaturase oxidoreductase [Pseudonocardiales bacterium]|jgi:ferredoxin-NADP reductase|nr:stearoyl-CoA 9-desaturase oxidoreductase [Pseudonocardiales bacterium]
MVERGAEPRTSVVRRRVLGAARALTTPLLPDDYLGLLNPAWSARELTGTVMRLKPETATTTTVVLKPNFPWTPHRPGQYLRIGAEVNGVRHWRAYTITSDPDHPEGLLSITVKHVETGLMSGYFTRAVRPGSLVFLSDVEGEFKLPAPLPERSLFISAGSGVTPIWAMLRDLERRGALQDALHVHCAREPEHVIFGADLRRMNEQYDGYTLHEHHTGKLPRLNPDSLAEICPDWRERHTFLSGPPGLMDVMEKHWAAEGDPDLLFQERFQPIIGLGDAEVGSGGTVSFRVTDVEATCDVGVSILVGGEAAGARLPYGCRLGICHTCKGKLRSGKVRDLRTGELHGEAGQTVRTCVNAPEGPVEIEL